MEPHISDIIRVYPHIQYCEGDVLSYRPCTVCYKPSIRLTLTLPPATQHSLYGRLRSLSASEVQDSLYDPIRPPFYTTAFLYDRLFIRPTFLARVRERILNDASTLKNPKLSPSTFRTQPTRARRWEVVRCLAWMASILQEYNPQPITFFAHEVVDLQHIVSVH